LTFKSFFNIYFLFFNFSFFFVYIFFVNIFSITNNIYDIFFRQFNLCNQPLEYSKVTRPNILPKETASSFNISSDTETWALACSQCQRYKHFSDSGYLASLILLLKSSTFSSYSNFLIFSSFRISLIMGIVVQKSLLNFYIKLFWAYWI